MIMIKLSLQDYMRIKHILTVRQISRIELTA